MNIRLAILIPLALLLTACNFSLAQDVTPPPNYVPPTAMPTLGPLYPSQPPSLERGAAVYAEKCVECHGPAGMGDGDKGKQLPVTVAALGLPQVARKAAPADWYTMVSRGNIERSMPPFDSLNDQQRWDVVAYAMSLHVTPEEIEKGKTIFESHCAGCALNFFKNTTGMATLSADEVVALLKTGNADATALADDLTDDDYYAVAAWLRTLTYESSLPPPTPEPATATPTLISTEATPAATEAVSATPGAETPTAEGPVPSAVERTLLATATGSPVTPGAETPTLTGSETPAASTGAGRVTGTIVGGNVFGLEVALRGLEHGQDQTSGPQEVIKLTSTVKEDGTYAFENVDLPEGRIFLAEVVYLGVTYQSELAVAGAGASEVVVPEIKVYETSEDFSSLKFSQVHFFIEIADQNAQVVGVYTFSNEGDKAYVVKATVDVPFIKMPDGAQNIGFDITQDSAPIMAAKDGFALLPAEKPYGLVAFYSLPYDGGANIAQPFFLSADSVLLLAPKGVKVKSDLLTPGEMQTFQGVNYQGYTASNIKAGDVLDMNLSGKPKTGVPSDTRQGLLIGAGALGVVLILAGIWMYLRDRNRSEEEELDDEEEEFESEEDILDAIIALDDLHRAEKIPAEAYQSRRAELKSRLKDLE